MARGGSDYGVLSSEIAKAIDPQDEIVVASRGINSVDGLGRLYHMDTFQGGVQGWTRQALGDGASPVVRFGSGEVGDVGVYMYAGTTKDTSYSFMSKGFRLDGGVSAGVEVGIRIPNARAAFKFRVAFRSSIGYVIGELQYMYDGKLNVLHSDANYHQIDTLTGTSGAATWVPIKMVLNVSTLAYDRIIVGQKRYENLSYQPQSFPPSTTSELLLSLTAMSGGGTSIAQDVGHLIITTDEP